MVIVDYGMGNLRSVQKGFERVGVKAMISRDPNLVSEATHLVVPGVGGFKDCMGNLEAHGLLEPIREAINADLPYLGICLGLQILFSEGTEFGSHPGMGVIPGRVLRFPGTELKIPHMGWNQIQVAKESPVLEGIPEGSFFYFVHSYYGLPDEAGWVATMTDYGAQFPSAVSRGRLFACQFHPEKSQGIGMRLLSNFARLN
ncbi:MAG: imidazole glycerol phosphate synthase subunit HisH [Nitrospira sp.]|nr:imidazole glycerol phosphate synthase subunit HisH [Candidatus Manganitrophaceae bacterium]HIL34676.1 imidazole glycerol phosphate synthase subunit HisH [Candidatus Manganitrophaceae bacterium]